MAPLTLTILVSMLRMHGADATITSLSAIVASPPKDPFAHASRVRSAPTSVAPCRRGRTAESNFR